MSSVIPILLLGLSGLLVGGLIQLRTNGAARSTLFVMGALALVAAAGGVLWLLPE
ncbi:hypothetical protein GCM10009682_21940 [Luedemannella flava]|uniref:Uncharacterized protein n=1 Tax=Luedemannella flava TaxID=349316 RepID=A0ABP4Y0J1_9ACTN